MTLPELAWNDFLPVVPAVILSAGAALLLLSEAFASTSSRAHQAPIAFVSAMIAGGVAFALVFEPSRDVFQGMGVLDPFSSFTTAVVCIGLLLAILLGAGFLRQRHAERGEFYALMLFAGAGMSLLALSAELITLFINLEILSISTYALAAYLRRGARPSEAGFKYFILGAFSAALLLYGFALIYGATGTTQLSGIARALPNALERTPGLVYCAFALMAAGFGFKVAAVPFHMWTPDVYEGAPTPVTALMSVGVKTAAFAALVRVFSVIGTKADVTLPATFLSTLALLTMVVGNLLAIPQRNVKRMLAYSSIAHAGYLLLGVAALFVHPHVPAGASRGAGIGKLPLLDAVALTSHIPTSDELRSYALRAILFYLLAYTVTAAGAFGTVSALERREEETRGTGADLDRFSGLAQRRPWWAVAMAAFMLSLGGIPPTAGFMGKLLIFQSAVDAGLIGLTVVGVLSSVAGVYYYLRVVVYMFMRPATEGTTTPERHWPTELALALSTVAVLLLGTAPAFLSRWLATGGAIWGAQ